MKKLTIILTCLILLITIIPITISSNETLNNTIYVDDDNVEGPWFGTEEHPYQFIQDAIDNATYGDTIFVYNGTYYENLLIEKNLDLYGENRENTIIFGYEKGWAVKVFAQVTISGFTITSNNDYGAMENNGLEIKSDYNRISNNIIKENWLGLDLIESDYNNISNNIISSWIDGIFLSYCKYNTIWENIIKENCNGLNIYGGEGNRIIRNIIRRNRDGIIIGVSDNNYFYNNDIWDNFQLDIYIYKSENNIFKCNNIQNGKFLSSYFNFYLNRVQSEYSDNYWDGNCWGRGRIFPKLIFDPDAFKFEFDWHPAWKPYDIQVPEVR